jgi:murein DD-endopeptidase MepM/ murein hydrolase activator NlpD
VAAAVLIAGLPLGVFIAQPSAQVSAAISGLQDAATPSPPAIIPSPTPWQFVFPSPVPPASSAWRPPLYPVPWAPGPNDHFYFYRPIAADEVNWPEEDYRYGGIFPGSDIPHTGIDIAAPPGTPVIAAAEGTVVWAGYGLYRGVYDTTDPYGNAVAIRHPFGYHGQRLYTVYAHMSEVLVSAGQAVRTGDVLGKVGSTGKVTGPHLHFEVRVSDNDYFMTRNPELWIAPPQGWGVLVGRVMGTTGSLLANQMVQVKSLDTSQYWWVRTYGPEAVNVDPYYRENMVLSDLPAGDYTIVIEYLGVRLNKNVQIRPGQVSYFTFQGKNLYHVGTPYAAGFATPAP